MGFLAILNAYTMRVCLSITITEMAVSIKHNYTDQDTCKYDLNEKESVTNSTEGKYNWDERTQVKDILYINHKLIISKCAFMFYLFIFKIRVSR